MPSNNITTVQIHFKKLTSDMKKGLPNFYYMLGTMIAKDAKNQHLVPNSTGQPYQSKEPGGLGNSAIRTPTGVFKSGRVIWNKPYGPFVYKRNRTGVAYWDKEVVRINMSKYKKSFDKYMSDVIKK